ncbi:Benzoyl-CoA reductase subunit BadG [Thermodesulfovibrio sp. N1]|uniref:acyl-CoA dehydratase activase n=1 Tax=Thermodesulfovibrio sp. N1 TaxID=1871110 RepID=UPI00083A2CD6|nr:acyl-CoA dehydratase activase [Thermodesulfovibrio sp. N1]ODA43758.1 Benzoyl-CoA reductase subunit BadG [Thermodesulfovibrio sp. N1]
MISLGIDIGSRFIKALWLENGKILKLKKTETSYEPLKKCEEIINEIKTEKIVATGYGRHLFAFNGDISTITEIKAFAIGCKTLFPDCKTIIDIGGQDTKVINIDEEGNVKKFEMNDKCSAGTGRFLEIMAQVLGYSLEEFGEVKVDLTNPISISSMCTVFAESEVISMIAKGIPRENIALAIHKAITKKVIAMLKKISIDGNVVFAGGCSSNSLLQNLIEREIGKKLITNPLSPFAGAFGAAIYGDKIIKFQ